MAKGSSDRFTGKVAIVTGAGKGIGTAVARALARDGASVIIFDFDGDSARETEEAIRKEEGIATAVVGSVSVAADAQRAVEAAVENYGGVDFLVNNAGVCIYGEVPEMLEEDWDFVIDTNLKGIFLLSKYSIPEMRKRHGGAIVNLASVQALVSQREVAAYAATKGGIVSLTRTLALDHAKDKIRVNSVLPGSVRTPMLLHAAELVPGEPLVTIERWGKIHPRGTVIEPEEIANVVSFLLSDEASAITGAPYVVDAGLSSQAAF
ncbi:MAG TPA: SDR family NAD(P)-dependent oxidoreductase [Acidimicrobiales bacterium]|jgi:NAD(P)-dependent dehydrogenase (short-subunit alcohol dehydrogenase family)